MSDSETCVADLPIERVTKRRASAKLEMVIERALHTPLGRIKLPDEVKALVLNQYFPTVVMTDGSVDRRRTFFQCFKSVLKDWETQDKERKLTEVARTLRMTKKFVFVGDKDDIDESFDKTLPNLIDVFRNLTKRFKTCRRL